MRWEVRRARGTVRELHERSAARVAGPAGQPSVHQRLAVVQSPTDGAVVLGSAQPATSVDRQACASAGLEVVHRRSGGGAVLVEPGSVIWVDLVVAATDPLWSTDVGRSMWWVGETWAEALRRAGMGGLEVWKGAMLRSAWSSLVCFAGLGPGEVVDAARRKVVGISQRRARHGALFQCACLLRWEPDRLLELLDLPEQQRQTALHDLEQAAAGIGEERAQAVVEHLLAGLP
jgi:lipoate---protein ligase